MKKRISTYLGAIVAGVALVATPSCSDDHYLVDDVNGGYSNKTIWETIKENKDLSKFADILENARYYRDDKHPTDYTYKDVLSGNNTLTVWAPVNSGISEEEYNSLMERTKTDGYNLQQQFVGNHIALWRRGVSGEGSSEQFRLINNKISGIDYTGKTFMNTKMKDINIPAWNGTLHTLETINGFDYNFYELIKYNNNMSEFDLAKFKEFVVKRDTTYFNESGSIEGLPDENGNPTYVDSMYFTSNRMFMSKSWDDGADREWITKQYGFNAQLNTEDSLYIMIVPTSTAWDAAKDKLEPYYQYANIYPDMEKLTDKDNTYTTGSEDLNLDSLKSLNKEMDIIRNLVFNVNLQPHEGREAWTAETFLEYGAECDYFLTTYGDTIRSVYKEDENGNKTLVWDKMDLFKGTRRTLSNGIAIVTDEWPMPVSQYKKNVDVETCEYDAVMTIATPSNTTTNIEAFSNSIEGSDTTGHVKNERYLQVKGTSKTNQPELIFRLLGNDSPNKTCVMSGKYRVEAVMVPLYYDEVTDSIDMEKLKVETNLLQATIYYTDGTPLKSYYYNKQQSLKSDPIYYEGKKVQTVTLFDEFEFPVSYENIKYSYPVISIKSAASSSDTKKDPTLRRNQFNIDRIILVSLEEDNK